MKTEIARYIGIPFTERGRDREGVDCWGLVVLVYRDLFGIELPSYAEEYGTTTDAEEIGALVRRESRTVWQEVPLREARLGDVLLFRVRGQAMHCGLVVVPPTFLHCVDRIGSAIERWDSLLWEKRVSGVFRHAELAGLGERPGR